MTPNRIGLAMDELEPDYDDLSNQPKSLSRSRHIRDVYWLAGRQPQEEGPCDVMFVTVAAEEEEMERQRKSLFGHSIQMEAEYLKGATGVVRDVALRAGVDMDKSYYTALVKWLLPRSKRSKPPVKVLRYGIPVVEDEIRRVKPKIIVCLGKAVFDMLSERKISFDDAHGAWFWSERYNAHLYVTYAPYNLVARPEMYETFRIDFQEVARKRDIINGVGVEDDPATWTVIKDEQTLRSWALRMRAENHRLFAVDCEWHGTQHYDADLRSIQFCWSNTEAAVIMFRDEQNQWAFELSPETQELVTRETESAMRQRRQDGLPAAYALEEKKASYKAVGAIINEVVSDPEVHLIGHHFAADAVMMEHWLDISTYRKCIMDTEFAQQTVDESSELDLERGIAMKYTTLGFYSQELIEWKRSNRKLCEKGYGYIPESIIVPYSALDVISPFRAYPKIRKQLEAQGLWDYYTGIHNPFVTDTFTGFTLCGMPMDRERMDDLREVFHFARRHMEVTLKRDIHSDAKTATYRMVLDEFDFDLDLAGRVITYGTPEEALQAIKVAATAKEMTIDPVLWMKRLIHLHASVDFNIRSPDMMRRWLYDVSGLTPIKSTNQKAKGMPSMAWDKVLELPAERQKLYVPAVDKQTIQILSQQLPLLEALLDLNAVGNVCKAFLKEAEQIPIDIEDCLGDDDDNEDSPSQRFSVKEQGLHAWLSSPFDDGVCRILGMMSCTETSRPRSWRPNVLNIPSYVSKRIGMAIISALKEAHECGELPESLMKWLDAKSEKDIPSLRSCIKAPPGYVLVESDYQTAEMVALAVISGDEKLMRILFEEDPEWAVLKEKKYGEEKVRVAWSPTSETGIEVDKQQDRFIMAVWKDGKCLGPVTEADLKHNPDGSVKHAKFDIHWSVVERTYGIPREMMINKIHRNSGKVLNFSSAYGASAASLERKIESDTGVKPEPGVGERGLAAIAARQPRAVAYLDEMAAVPKTKGYYRAASGRIRHCVLHGRGADIGWRTRNAQESAMGREMRNYPMQESVASTSARACNWAQALYKSLGLKAKVMTCLYDSVVTLCPLEERFVVDRLHTYLMSLLNTWEYGEGSNKRTLKYGIDTEFNYRWSTRPTADESELLDNKDWCPTPPHLAWTLTFENWGMLVA